jgi:hypothetical protein
MIFYVVCNWEDFEDDSIKKHAMKKNTKNLKFKTNLFICKRHLFTYKEIYLSSRFFSLKDDTLIFPVMFINKNFVHIVALDKFFFHVIFIILGV